MLTNDKNKNKAAGKAGHRNKTEAAKKSEPRKRKNTEPAVKPDQLLEALQRPDTKEPAVEPVAEQARAPAVPTETAAARTALPETATVASAAAAVSLQTLANAYGDYSRRSFEQTSNYVTRLAGTRSFGGVLELQAAFAREAYETFIAESMRIRELHRELAKQRLARLERFVPAISKTR